MTLWMDGKSTLDIADLGVGVDAIPSHSILSLFFLFLVLVFWFWFGFRSPFFPSVPFDLGYFICSIYI